MLCNGLFSPCNGNYMCVAAFAAAGDTGFSVVAADADYAPAVAWCLEQRLMNGTGNATFSPDAALTRAMVATVLCRVAGEPVVDGAPALDDADANSMEFIRINAAEATVHDGLFVRPSKMHQVEAYFNPRSKEGEGPQRGLLAFAIERQGADEVLLSVRYALRYCR